MNYHDFDLEVFEHKQTSTGDTFSVRVADSPVGQQRISRAERVKLPLQARRTREALKKRMLSLAEMIQFGEQLGDALFPPRARSFLSASLSRLRSNEEGLRIRLKLDTYSLADLPWEYVYVPVSDVPDKRRGPEGFLALNRSISLVRFEAQAGPQVPTQAGVNPIRLVALLSSPQDPAYPPLDVEQERQWISQALGDVTAIRPEFFPHATTNTLLDALVRPAQIFHFSGHGEFQGSMGSEFGSQEGEGTIILEGENHRPVPFAAQKLAINLHGHGVRLAVLTACEVGQRDAENPWSGVASALTRAGIPAVVGMQFRIQDTNAIAFSRAFYRALAAGQPIEAAVTDGRFAIFNCGDDNERDWGVPVLYLRAENGVLFPQQSQPSASGAPAGPAQPPVSKTTLPQSATVDKRKLRDVMMKAFSSDDLEILCADVEASLASSGTDLQFSLDIVGGGSKAMQILNMIAFLERRGLLTALEKAVREARPGVL